MAKENGWEEGDHEIRRADEIVCPYCGEIHTDSWECADDEGEIECDECSKKFSYQRETSVTYNCDRDCELNGEQHEYLIKDLNNNGQMSWWCRKCPALQVQKPADSQIVVQER